MDQPKSIDRLQQLLTRFGQRGLIELMEEIERLEARIGELEAFCGTDPNIYYHQETLRQREEIAGLLKKIAGLEERCFGLDKDKAEYLDLMRTACRERDQLAVDLAEAQRRNRIVLCAFCGHEVDSMDPTERRTLIAAHILDCIQHPLRRACQELEDKYDEIRRLKEFSERNADDSI